MKKEYLLFIAVCLSFLSASCTVKPGKETNANYQDKNYMEGNQSDMDRNVQQMQKRREEDDRKIDALNIEQNKPK
ncbi:hypothetical protein ASG31_11055 [Chryseobacterium sp. Leaf404]|uniref:hypothetical protein n=1 Tax=unclassified Chryseobacterium TaxID=2593645 RepID=UPI0006F6DDA4|nr:MULTISPECIES: hypothetical protein [unclassified Chryseobacterium]KQT16903.1 hypothetical protein ASG31_11055 [Chryseobacterium sp. Leaf404]